MFFPVAAISMNLESKELTDMGALVKAGVKGFSDDGRCVMSDVLFKQALEKAKTLRVPVIEHAEDHSISQDGQINQGVVSAKFGIKGIPAKSEEVIIERDIGLQEAVGSFFISLIFLPWGPFNRSVKRKNVDSCDFGCYASPFVIR